MPQQIMQITMHILIDDNHTGGMREHFTHLYNVWTLKLSSRYNFTDCCLGQAFLYLSQSDFLKSDHFIS
jgi:hypothetical protein